MQRADLKKKSDVTLRTADKDAIPMTFDVSKVKSTVTNPSQMFKGISVDDEQKILNYVKQNYGNGSEFEKQQAVQGLYSAALKKQKQADIDAGRQQIKLDLINKANNASVGKEQNTYLSQVKKADLADLIKYQLVQQGYNKNDFMNITDEGIIAGFLETNPEYKDAFNRFFYDNKSKLSGDKKLNGDAPYYPNDVIQLGKDLGWIEKTGLDKVKDKLGAIGEGMVGWMPKWAEGVDDFTQRFGAGTDQYRSKEKGLNEAAFANYVKEKYGTYAGALTDRDLAQAKKDFENENKKEYTPTYGSAFTKMAMGLTDIAFTSGGLGAPLGEKAVLNGLGKNIVKNDLFKLGFSTLAADDNMSRAPELLGDALSLVGENVNKLPGFKQIRDSLQTEQDKADWDAFVAGNVLSFLRKGSKKVNQIKDADVQGWKQSFDEIKKGNVKGGMETLKENARENRVQKYNESKLKKAQEVGQGEIETRESMSKGLDTLSEEGKLKNVKSVDDLSKVTKETIDRLKSEQTEIAQKETKRFSQSDLGLEGETDILDEAGNKSKQAIIQYPFDNLLDNMIEYYEDTNDIANATKYKSYKNALSKGTLPAETILEVRREANSLNQNVFNDKTNMVKDTKKAKIWADNMKQVNEIVDGLDIGEDIRSRDAKLSSLYTLNNGLERIKKASANYEKKMIKDGGSARWLGKTTSRVLSKLSFGTTNFLSKALVSLLQESAELGGFEKMQYNPYEIANKVPEFVADYESLLQKIEGNNVSKSRIIKLANEFADKWQLEVQFNEEDD